MDCTEHEKFGLVRQNFSEALLLLKSLKYHRRQNQPFYGIRGFQYP